MEVLYGWQAGLALLRHRAADVVSVAYSAERWGRELDEALGRVSRQVGVHEASERDLEREAGTSHHEGLVLTVRERRWLTPADLAEGLRQSRGVALALDRVRNPYNVGAILRSAAFFGVDAVLLGAPAPHPALAPDAVRVAEGGSEHVRLARTTDLATTLQKLRERGVTVVGADGASEVEVTGYDFAPPVVVVMGNEREGMSERVRAQCDAIVAIGGTGAVESLNVAVAAGVLIAEVTRRRRPGQAARRLRRS